MNDVINAILGRRSVRSFKKQAVEIEKLELLAKCGTYAPSGMNSQPWHFSIISKKQTLEKISAINKGAALNSGVAFLQKMAEAENFDCFRGASSAIVISCKKDSLDAAGYAAENIALGAYSLGLGSCIVGSVKIGYEFGKSDELAKIFNFPEEYELAVAVAIGYPEDKELKAPDRKENLISIID